MQRQVRLALRVDDVVERWRLQHNAEPAKWVGALKPMQHLRENGSPGYAVDTIAPGDEITCDGSRLAISCKRYH